MATTFDADDYELRWPPQLFVDEAQRLRGRKSGGARGLFGVAEDGWAPEIEWLLTEAFVSTVPAEAFRKAQQSSATWGGPPKGPSAEEWISQLIQEAAAWPEPGTRKPYWSARIRGQDSRPRISHSDFTRSFIHLIEELEGDGYLVHAFGQDCVDRDGPGPDPSAVLTRRLSHTVAWPIRRLGQKGLSLDYLCDLIEVFHDLVARPSSRFYHDFSGCGWHYSAFATGPGRRLYRWRLNRLLASSDLGLRLAESGEDLGRLVRVEPTGLEDLPERAVQAASPETRNRVRHAITLFRARTASLEERRSAVITLAGILEERRDLLKAELLSKDEGALFHIANGFAVRHQRADQRGDYDSAFLDWLFWWYLGTIELTDQLLARQAAHQN